jgi:hypothetical protein
VGRLQFEDHDGYDDGDHAITERDKPILFHRSSFPPLHIWHRLWP